VFSETEVVYAGKRIDLIPKVAEVVSGLGESVKTVVLLPSAVTGRELSAIFNRFVVIIK
jgi:acetoacetyl-CoA synthetase